MDAEINVVLGAAAACREVAERVGPGVPWMAEAVDLDQAVRLWAFAVGCEATRRWPALVVDPGSPGSAPFARAVAAICVAAGCPSSPYAEGLVVRIVAQAVEGRLRRRAAVLGEGL